jgi:glycosyltransferase involved in cell wall biosynthesis
MGFLGIPADHVYTSVYPIETSVHYPREIPPEQKLEILSDPSGKLIVHISRFSNRKARVAFELIKAMPAILAKELGARLLIVGSGPMFDEIKRRADELNERIGPMVRVDGPRLDVSDLFNMADVVIATATTAMEAMTCGAPLIAAGRTGYFGFMTDSRFEAGHDVLFADHGRCPSQTTAELLTRDILNVFSDPAQAKSAAAEIAARMARDFNPASAAENATTLYETVIREAK